MNNVREGLQILMMYADFELHTGHDQIFCGPLEVRDEHKEMLLACGWFVAEDSWSHFV